MSFELELHAEVPSWEQADRAVAATRGPGFLSVAASPRRRRLRRRKPGVSFDWHEGQSVLGDDAKESERTFTLSDDGRDRLAATVLVLAEVLQPGWGVRAYWVGDALQEVRVATAEELADLVRSSALDRGTLYRVQ